MAAVVIFSVWCGFCNTRTNFFLTTGDRRYIIILKGVFLLRLFIDYCTFHSSVDLTIPKLESILGSDLCFSEGRNEGSLRVSPFGVSWFPNIGGNSRSGFDMPVRTQFSGDGCRNYLTKLPAVYESTKSYIKRLDITSDFVMSRDRWREICTECFTLSMSDDQPKYKRVHLISGGIDGSTIYAGYRGSSYYFRIYNKTAESPRFVSKDDEGNDVQVGSDELLIRFELELMYHSRTQGGKKYQFDPTKYFLSYFGDGSQLKDDYYHIWESYIPVSWLPFTLEDVQAAVLTKELFCSINSDFEAYGEIPPEVKNSEGIVKPADYVVKMFGKYIPFVVMDPYLWNQCIDKFEAAFGASVQIEIVRTGFKVEVGFDDLVEAEIEDSLPAEWVEMPYDEYIEPDGFI